MPPYRYRGYRKYRPTSKFDVRSHCPVAKTSSVSAKITSSGTGLHNIIHILKLDWKQGTFSYFDKIAIDATAHGMIDIFIYCPYNKRIFRCTRSNYYEGFIVFYR